MSLKYFEDLEVGRSREFGGHTVSEESVIRFAGRYDPQPFHLDEKAAQQSIFGGLIASGWHTAALMMRMLVDHELSDYATVGSPGFDDLRWIKPVRPGDTIRVRACCIDKQPSRARPTLGSAHYELEVLNQRHEVVASVIYIVLLRRRAS